MNMLKKLSDILAFVCAVISILGMSGVRIYLWVYFFAVAWMSGYTFAVSIYRLKNNSYKKREDKVI